VKRIVIAILFLTTIVSCIEGEQVDNTDIDWLLEEDDNQPSETSEDQSVDSKELNLLKDNENLLSPAEKLLSVTVTISLHDVNGALIGIGSGVFVDKNLIATNYHVVENEYDFIKIKNNADQTEFNGTIKKFDPLHDVALLTSNFSCMTPIKISSNLPKIGDDIMVAGSPQGLEGTISKGIISSIRKFDPYDYELIQISAPISEGSSGGPVVNSSGELIGISVSGMKEGQNLNFAVPVKYISHLLD
jgi:S1-C subfamily serine protease